MVTLLFVSLSSCRNRGDMLLVTVFVMISQVREVPAELNEHCYFTYVCGFVFMLTHTL